MTTKDATANAPVKAHRWRLLLGSAVGLLIVAIVTSGLTLARPIDPFSVHAEDDRIVWSRMCGDSHLDIRETSDKIILERRVFLVHLIRERVDPVDACLALEDFITYELERPVSGRSIVDSVTEGRLAPAP